MFQIDLIYLGNEREKNYKEAADEYIKRLGAFCNIRTKNIKDERLSEKPSKSEISAALEKEAKHIREALPEKSFKIALCVEGKQMSSEKFSSLIKELPNRGFSCASFIIGSSYGLDESLKKECDMRLSLSEMTFPHKLFKVMLLEQIYRAFMIAEGGKYHK